MGREIRRVPPNWEHPKETKGQYERGQFVVKEVYKPLLDGSFEQKAKDWLIDLQKWLDGTHESFIYALNNNPDDDKPPQTIRGYCDHYQDFPRMEYYHPEWDEADCTAYQIYETVSEGTPVSPVFQTEQEIIDWLVSQGHSLNSATQFVKHKWAPTMLMAVNPDGTGTFATGIDTFDMP
jgi:hypothetical protein